MNNPNEEEPELRKRKRADYSKLSPDERVIKRKLKNRMSAQQARDRKKYYVTQLEDKLESLEKENNYLRKLCSMQLRGSEDSAVGPLSLAANCAGLPVQDSFVRSVGHCTASTQTNPPQPTRKTYVAIIKQPAAKANSRSAATATALSYLPSTATAVSYIPSLAPRILPVTTERIAPKPAPKVILVEPVSPPQIHSVIPTQISDFIKPIPASNPQSPTCMPNSRPESPIHTFTTCVKPESFSPKSDNDQVDMKCDEALISDDIQIPSFDDIADNWSDLLDPLPVNENLGSLDENIFNIGSPDSGFSSDLSSDQGLGSPNNGFLNLDDDFFSEFMTF